MRAELHGRISGAIYDFMGYLTTSHKVVTSSRFHEPHDLLDSFCKWAELRGLDKDNADVEDWNYDGFAEALIEFYTMGRLPTRDPGLPGTAGSSMDTGRPDDDYTRRRKWLNARPQGGIGSVASTHPDDPPKYQRSDY